MAGARWEDESRWGTARRESETAKPDAPESPQAPTAASEEPALFFDDDLPVLSDVVEHAPGAPSAADHAALLERLEDLVDGMREQLCREVDAAVNETAERLAQELKQDINNRLDALLTSLSDDIAPPRSGD